MPRMWQVVLYGLRKRTLSYLVFCALLVAFLLLWLCGGQDAVNTFWNEYPGTFTSILTLGVAGAIWFTELREEYLNALPKRMTVSFTYTEGDTEKLVMICNRAFLFGESDMRALAQQIGRQMSDSHLSMKPMLDNVTSETTTDEAGAPIMHYKATIVLRELPPKIAEVYENRQVRVWNPPFTRVAEDISLEKLNI